MLGCRAMSRKSRMASGITLAGAVWTDLGPGNWGIKTHELYTSHTSKVIDIWNMHSN